MHAAKSQSLEAGERLDRVLRRAFSGSARAAVTAQYESAREGRVNCSPYVFLHDGTDLANPGIEAHGVNGHFGQGFPVIDRDRPEVYEELLAHAARLLP
ncbi:hypothetical protein OHA37_03535 [Streptomyces sp. NBC_00335]|uniref:hypothetical protein n=1 Tax=unclassified Streptomyces TaxID=2593676 RepID=UPI002257065E|nr:MULTISPECIES: hypothetical protein [unclassified Streptomyces]MCX5402957.1 hypothetical protein [Streptomyces sp. NBC_00086]